MKSMILDKYLEKIVSVYRSKLTGSTGNNGIKEDNIKKIFKPIGFERILKDPSLSIDFIGSINQLSSDRGLFAHTSINDPSIMNRIQPKDLINSINVIKQGLKFIVDEIKAVC
jgi:hypothetical protein